MVFDGLVPSGGFVVVVGGGLGGMSLRCRAITKNSLVWKVVPSLSCD